MVLKFCPKCGNDLDLDSEFCNGCGHNLKERKKIDKKMPKEKERITEKKSQKRLVSSSFGEYAGFWKRFLAVLIDFIIIGVINNLFWPIRFYEYNSSPPFVTQLVPDWLVGLNNLTHFIIAFFYFWILESRSGKTLGKLIAGIRTVDEESLEKASKAQHAKNNILKANLLLMVIDFFIGFIVNHDKPEERLRIMQNASNTVVIIAK